MKVNRPAEMITVGIITNNDIAGIPQTLKSVTDLGLNPIVVDIGSSDGTQRVAGEFDARVLEMKAETSESQAWSALLEQVETDWVLKVNPGQIIAMVAATDLMECLKKEQCTNILLREYDINHQGDFFYRNALVKKAFANSYQAEENSFKIDDGCYSNNISLKYTNREFYFFDLENRLDKINQKLASKPTCISSLFLRAWYYQQLEKHQEFSVAVQDGIKTLTDCDPVELIGDASTAGIFGFYAESLTRLDIVPPGAVDSLVQLKANMPNDIRLNRPLAKLLAKDKQYDSAISLLQAGIFHTVNSQTQNLSYFHGFIWPVIDLLELLIDTSNEDNIINLMLDLQVRAKKLNFDVQTMFEYIFSNNKDLFRLLEGGLKRKLEDIKH